MKALIVGGGGFLGGAIARELRDAGFEAVSLATRESAAAALVGDVRRDGLGLAPGDLDELRRGLTHIVSCFGSVDWESGPGQVELHELGTRRVLDFAEGCEDLRRMVHVSSILAFGTADEPVANATLDVGQGFRSWYEYAKFRAELAVVERVGVPVRTVRFGPLLGVSNGRTASPRAGILAAVPSLLRGYPLHLADHGGFPCYAVDVEAAAGVVRRALVEDGDGRVWTFFERRGPTLAEALSAVCAAWGVLPRIVDLPTVGLLGRALGRRLGVPAALHAYTRPWVTFEPGVLEALPPDLPSSRDGYLNATGRALRRSHRLAAAW